MAALNGLCALALSFQFMTAPIVVAPQGTGSAYEIIGEHIGDNDIHRLYQRAAELSAEDRAVVTEQFKEILATYPEDQVGFAEAEIWRLIQEHEEARKLEWKKLSYSEIGGSLVVLLLATAYLGVQLFKTHKRMWAAKKMPTMGVKRPEVGKLIFASVAALFSIGLLHGSIWVCSEIEQDFLVQEGLFEAYTPKELASDLGIAINKCTIEVPQGR